MESKKFDPLDLRGLPKFESKEFDPKDLRGLPKIGISSEDWAEWAKSVIEEFTLIEHTCKNCKYKACKGFRDRKGRCPEGMVGNPNRWTKK